MQNKRGISQAFQAEPQGQILRPATVFDVFDIGRALNNAILRLDRANHLDQAQKLQSWRNEMEPAALRSRIAAGQTIWLMVQAGQIIGIGAADATDRMTLLDPDLAHERQENGERFSQMLERDISDSHCGALPSEATETERTLLLKHGGFPDGSCSFG